MIVREKCKHGKYDEHTLVVHWTPTVIDADMDVCPGGREIVLVEKRFRKGDQVLFEMDTTVYVENT